MSWWRLTEDLLAFVAAHEGLAGVPVVLGPETRVPAEDRILLSRGAVTGDRTRTGTENEAVVWLECWAVTDGDWHDAHRRLDVLEEHAMGAVRDWRLIPNRFAGMRYQAECGETQPDGGAFAPNAVASRTRITIRWTRQR